MSAPSLSLKAFSGVISSESGIIVSAHTVDEKVAKSAIKAIHASIGWSEYDKLIFYSYDISSFKRERLLLYQNGDAIEGYIDFDKTVAIVPFMAVRREVQSTGIGIKLMQAVFDRVICEGGSSELSLRFKDRFSLVNFYTKSVPGRCKVPVKACDSEGVESNGDVYLKLTYDLKSKKA